jgi:hypothetical protein
MPQLKTFHVPWPESPNGSPARTVSPQASSSGSIARPLACTEIPALTRLPGQNGGSQETAALVHTESASIGARVQISPAFASHPKFAAVRGRKGLLTRRGDLGGWWVRFAGVDEVWTPQLPPPPSSSQSEALAVTGLQAAGLTRQRHRRRCSALLEGSLGVAMSWHLRPRRPRSAGPQHSPLSRTRRTLLGRSAQHPRRLRSAECRAALRPWRARRAAPRESRAPR